MSAVADALAAVDALLQDAERRRREGLGRRGEGRRPQSLRRWHGMCTCTAWTRWV
jgi:hypothetical protein